MSEPMQKAALALRAKYKAARHYWMNYDTSLSYDEVLLKHFHEYNPKAEIIGRGIARVVVVLPEFPDVVFKIQDDDDISNQREWDVYQSTTDRKRKILLAKALHLYADGSVLVMERVRGTLMRERPIPQHIVSRVCTHFNQLFGQYDFHNENLIYCDRRKRYIAVDYAND